MTFMHIQYVYILLLTSDEKWSMHVTHENMYLIHKFVKPLSICYI